MPKGEFEFDSMGIGRLLNRGRLSVPPNQRSYAWEEEHVSALLQDISEAIANKTEDYFVGTIVLVSSDTAEPSIVDGQQRLATAAIILSRIRNRLCDLGRVPSAQTIDRDYLRQHDIGADREVPRLRLNTEDHEFFLDRILRAPFDLTPPNPPSDNDDIRASNVRQLRACEVADAFFAELLDGKDNKAQAEVLVQWVKFIAEGVRVVVVNVGDEIGAYRMFETLNDRGLRASQADILKNFFFSRAGARLHEAQMRWSGVSGAIETSGDDDENELLLNYLRHLWVTKYGPTKEKDLAADIKRRITNANNTMQFLTEAHNAVDTYLALSLRSQAVGDFKSGARQHIHTIAHHLKVNQIRPLLFAIARQFSTSEQEKALKLCVSWSVRFLIFGSGRGGMLDKQYSTRAEEIGNGKIKTARQLRDAMREYVPADSAFEQAFATARVSRPHLARYYLRALDKTLKGDPAPEYVANEDETEINLEHVMPLNPSAEWQIDKEAGQIAQKLLGNMVLLRASRNSALGNTTFEEKKKVYKESAYAITNPVAKFKQWTLDEIRQRQADMAKIAVKTWAID
jgi:hypothetical protein